MQLIEEAKQIWEENPNEVLFAAGLISSVLGLRFVAAGCMGYGLYKCHAEKA